MVNACFKAGRGLARDSARSRTSAGLAEGVPAIRFVPPITGPTSADHRARRRGRPTGFLPRKAATSRRDRGIGGSSIPLDCSTNDPPAAFRSSRISLGPTSGEGQSSPASLNPVIPTSSMSAERGAAPFLIRRRLRVARTGRSLSDTVIATGHARRRQKWRGYLASARVMGETSASALRLGSARPSPGGPGPRRRFLGAQSQQPGMSRPACSSCEAADS